MEKTKITFREIDSLFGLDFFLAHARTTAVDQLPKIAIFLGLYCNF